MILIVDDDDAIRLSLGLLLKRAGYAVDTSENPVDALDKIRATRYSLIMMDMNYSRSTTGEEGIALLRKAKIFQPETPVILITAWGSIELAVEGIKAGAYDFITKPWNNRVLLQRIETALDLNSSCDNEGERQFERCGIICRNREMNDLLATVERIAPTNAPVLILGENGTGKEMIANAIHANSRRKDNPFVMVNLGGIAQSLFESEMFGHSKGAFTGAVVARKGRFELADKGTIFLDEIGDLDMGCQVKLLRVLQQHTFEVLGESRPRKVDIRVVCATNADIPAMVRERTFREDLFYRINLITLRIPALRERRDDIPLLVRHFISLSAKSQGISIPEISSEAMEYLTRLSYPGNIRQLKNMVERAVLIGGDLLEKVDFSNQAGVEDEVGIPSAGTLCNMEKTAIEQAIEKSDGNFTQAARMLGITRQTLYRRMEKYGLK
ncbi:MAG: sigma-54 dependent transcriptional regulator [Muribaculaceae bacterium]|nr:sigma-54 dependent transcriptional regulator [Muribaculaceae bacterium]MDE6533531.1 sigma-54 dependent transcriptional regulator [Muribaculaceae bacterium]